MIAGIGTDIVATARLLRLLERYGKEAVKKILSGEEIEIFQERFCASLNALPGKENLPEKRRLQSAAAFLAKRFAAKEALSKAFGTGIRAPLVFPAITVKNNALGQPFFSYSPELTAWVETKNVTVNLSISDERDYAVAFVVLESSR